MIKYEIITIDVDTCASTDVTTNGDSLAETGDYTLCKYMYLSCHRVEYCLFLLKIKVTKGASD